MTCFTFRRIHFVGKYCITNSWTKIIPTHSPKRVDNYALNTLFEISGITYSTIMFDFPCDALRDNGAQTDWHKKTQNEIEKKCLLNGDTKWDSNNAEALMGISAAAGICVSFAHLPLLHIWAAVSVQPKHQHDAYIAMIMNKKETV